MSYIGKQFHKPTGLSGRIAAFVMNRQNQAQYGGVERALALAITDTALDIGFGNGYLLGRFAAKYGCRLFGVDISSDMLQVASRRCRRYITEGKMVLSLGDAQSTGFANEFFSKVYTVNTIYFWTDLAAGFDEVRRILRPGGIFVNGFYPKETLDKLLVGPSNNPCTVL